jgi:hypothetical protein
VPVTFHVSGWVEKELRAARVHAIYSPAPERPFSLWYQRVHSGGYYQMTIDPKTGLVTDVKMLNSSRVLSFDQSCLRTFRTWRYQPHTVTTEKVWVSF